MDSFQELIIKRRSTRKFVCQVLSPDQAEMILKAGLMAPSSKSSNPCQFLVVEKREDLNKLALCKKTGSSFVSNCALAVIVLADPMTSDVWIEDASIASIMMQLQAEDLGLGSCWTQVRERFTSDDVPSDEYIRVLFDIPLQLQILSVIAFGHKDKERPAFDEEKLQWEKVHIGKYNL